MKTGSYKYFIEEFISLVNKKRSKSKGLV